MFLVITQDGTAVDDETINTLFELPTHYAGNCSPGREELLTLRQQRMEQQKKIVEESNKKYHFKEYNKLDTIPKI